MGQETIPGPGSERDRITGENIRPNDRESSGRRKDRIIKKEHSCNSEITSIE